MKNLAEIRNLTVYAKVIDTLLMSYIKIEEFATSSDRERSPNIVDSCAEL